MRYLAALHPDLLSAFLPYASIIHFLEQMESNSWLGYGQHRAKFGNINSLAIRQREEISTMAIRALCHFPNDPVLRQKAKRVPAIDGSIQQLIDDMVETMQQASGVGLAAPQVGVPLRVIVLRVPDEEPVAIINPEIVKRAGEREVTEGCLSVPGYAGEIKRSVSVTVKGWNRQGKAIRIKATGLMAQTLEHELDHLNGVLYIDHLESRDKLYKVETGTGPEEM